jgi:AcrR family transcriptional regulator
MIARRPTAGVASTSCAWPARVFTEKGYRATSLQEIADEVDVARPSFYYHFKSKQEVWAPSWTPPSSASRGSVMDQLRDFIRRHVEVNTDHGEVPVLFQSLEARGDRRLLADLALCGLARLHSYRAPTDGR